MADRKTREVISVAVRDDEYSELDYAIEAWFVPAVGKFRAEKWLIGDEDAAQRWVVYPGEIDAYIELLTAMKEEK